MEELIEKFNKIADIRILLLNHPDREMVRAACEHFIGEPVGESDKLKEFYDWYCEANAAPRTDVLNELERRLGLPVEEYPKESYRYSEEFVVWYSGMKPEQVLAAYKRYHREIVDKWMKDIKQGILELKTKPKPKPGELEL